MDRYGVGGVNRPVSKPQNRSHYSYMPIHIAIENGHVAVVEALLKYGADVHRELSAARNKNSPLMVAAYSGNLDMVKLLVAHEAKVEQKGETARVNHCLSICCSEMETAFN